MEKKPTRGKEAEESGDGGGFRQRRSSGSASSGAIPPPGSQHNSRLEGFTDVGATSARQGEPLASDWQGLEASMRANAAAAPQHQMPPSYHFSANPSLAVRSTSDTSGLGSIASSDAAASMMSGQIDVTALLRAQQSMQSEGGLRSSVAAPSSQSSLSDPPDSRELLARQQQLLLQQQLQQQIDPSLLASLYLQQLQPSFGTPLQGAPPLEDYQAAQLRAASSTLYSGTANLPNVGGLGQNLSFSSGGFATGQAGVPTAAPVRDASEYASLRGGSIGQGADVSVSRAERGRRPLGTHPAMTGVTRGVLEPFPERLHRLLSEVEAAGLSDVVSFTEDGNAFRIHKPEDFFRKIVQVYFKQTRLSSFKRQLNLYGFEAIEYRGRSKGAFYHPLFSRSRPDLARQIRRVDNQMAIAEKKRMISEGLDSSRTPDFYNMPPILTSQEAEQKQAARRMRAEEEDETMETDSTSSDKKSGSSSDPILTSQEGERKQPARLKRAEEEDETMDTDSASSDRKSGSDKKRRSSREKDQNE